MNRPTFNCSTARWDRFKRFYCEFEHNLIVFENGEVMLAPRDFKPDQRGMKRKLGGGDSDLRVVSTIDLDCPALSLGEDSLTPEGLAVLARCRQSAAALASKALPKAWIDGGRSRLLLVDASTGRSVGINGNKGKEGRNAAWQWAPFSAADYYNPLAYIPGPQSKVVGENLRISVPVKLTPEEKRALQSLKEACTAWCELCSWDAQKMAPKYHRDRQGYRYKGVPSYNQPCPPDDLPKGMESELCDLAPERIFQIARHGFERPAHDMWVECLYAAL